MTIVSLGCVYYVSLSKSVVHTLLLSVEFWHPKLDTVYVWPLSGHHHIRWRVLNPTSHPKATLINAPNSIPKTHLNPSECLRCKVEADLGVKRGGVGKCTVGFEQKWD